ncbi:uncharacterized protein LOC129778177 [Toxorhynchites rutilus septentrionalis]|uniref:uncharacterized protein LOC129778177 n=1 Tax=Toxorhynchites rutilus septentrionalis TaxID=329112 RepID=UPI002479C2E0|nr:uncharacterized protein LOC129778177 [Toxorhynchites rutilus septentrionalis]XP_055640891.1 uncharacterized protein LOC129778177 [Toxorhynchites rutilus septentrionalis]
MDTLKGFSTLPSFSYADVPLAKRRSKCHVWKRGFEICLHASKVTNVIEKKDLLLAQGGFGLQEIFFNTPGAAVEEDKNNGIDPYEVAIPKLDCYFAPQRHEAYERYIFWATQPETDEGLEKFLMRVQVHASKCNFGMSATASSGIAVIDKMLQFVPPPLREKLLQDSNLTIEEMIKIHPNQRKQCKAFGDPACIVGVLMGQTSARHGIKPAGTATKEDIFESFVLIVLPGDREISYHHLIRHCHRPTRRQQEKKNAEEDPRTSFSTATGYSSGRPAQNKITRYARKVHAIDDVEVNNEEVELVEMVHDSEELVWANVGGVLIEMQIDSGVQSNIIDDQTWDVMIRKGVHTIGVKQ